MGSNKSFINYELLYHLYLLRVHPYGVDRVYSVLIEESHKETLVHRIFNSPCFFSHTYYPKTGS